MNLVHKEKTTRVNDESKNAKRSHVAVKVWSEPLQAHLWVVADKEDIELFTTHGLRGEIYTADEIQKLNCMDRDSMKALHTILFDD
ncbi:MAG TPA: hypothetical protein VEF37_06925 [Thermodesulfovibrionales bacterium]|nr:hypothetical protein [Thermodesulfovibrionales bacterium]